MQKINFNDKNVIRGELSIIFETRNIKCDLAKSQEKLP